MVGIDEGGWGWLLNTMGMLGWLSTRGRWSCYSRAVVMLLAGGGSAACGRGSMTRNYVCCDNVLDGLLRCRFRINRIFATGLRGCAAIRFWPQTA